MIENKHANMVRLLEEQHKETTDSIVQLQNKTIGIDHVLAEVTQLKSQVSTLVKNDQKGRRSIAAGNRANRDSRRETRVREMIDQEMVERVMREWIKDFMTKEFVGDDEESKE